VQTVIRLESYGVPFLHALQTSVLRIVGALSTRSVTDYTR
jgi:hypothetical protein